MTLRLLNLDEQPETLGAGLREKGVTRGQRVAPVGPEVR